MTAEKIVLDHLKKELQVPVSFEHRTGETGNFIILERVGGRIRGHIETASFAIQSYGDSLLSACELNDQVRSAMNRLIENEHISSVELDSDYNWTDQETKHYRYQGIYDLVLF